MANLAKRRLISLHRSYFIIAEFRARNKGRNLDGETKAKSMEECGRMRLGVLPHSAWLNLLFYRAQARGSGVALSTRVLVLPLQVAIKNVPLTCPPFNSAETIINYNSSSKVCLGFYQVDKH